MKAYLKEEFAVHNEQGKKIIHLPKGSEIQVIRFEYVPKEEFSDLSEWQLKTVRDECLITYVRGKFLAIPKEICYVPKVIGWNWNLVLF